MDIDIGNDKPFFLIAGPCQIESEEHAYKMASELTEITNNCLLYTSDAADE